MDFVAEKLRDAYDLMPLVQPEDEQYCFGPGKPTSSKQRLSIPVGIGGKAAIIRTSLIEEKIPGLQAGPNKIPFLAGQDWLLMMKAVIDIGANEVEFKTLGVRVPLYMDTSGHLTVAIDEL